jgi:hypothetical protein
VRSRAASLILVAAILATFVCFPSAAQGAAGPAPQGADAPTVFAVIGDYGMDNANEAAVAELVASWGPAYIITTGDDYYAPAGGSGTGRYDESTGAYYGAWLKDITTTGTRCPVGLAPVNAFFPSMGNHDYSDATPAPDSYLTYFALPGADFTSSSGNERFYDFVAGPVHFFVLDSCSQEPSGTSSTSAQALWLQARLAASTSAWNIVYDHHPPYSSDASHGSTAYMQWPFAAWGADAVISGHAHSYERIVRDGIVYFVNGLGGASRYAFGTRVTGSAVRYSANWGAQKVTAGSATLTFDFYNVAGALVDSYTLTAPAGPSTHVGDLDGRRVLREKGKTWDACVTVAVHDAGHKPVPGAVVTGVWSGGALGSVSAITNADGICMVAKRSLARASTSVTFTVTGVVRSNYPYTSPADHDPDGGSDGTTITVRR